MENDKEKLPSVEDIAAQLKEDESSEKEPQKNDTTIEQLIELLSSHNHEHKDAGLELLKSEKSTGFLIDAITQTQEKNHKATLIAACWESGLDFKGHELFFASLALDTDMFISLEAITVLDTMEMDAETMRNIISKIDEKTLFKHPNKEMLIDLKDNLTKRINNPNTDNYTEE